MKRGKKRKSPNRRKSRGSAKRPRGCVRKQRRVQHIYISLRDNVVLEVFNGVRLHVNTPGQFEWH